MVSDQGLCSRLLPVLLLLSMVLCAGTGLGGREGAPRDAFLAVPFKSVAVSASYSLTKNEAHEPRLWKTLRSQKIFNQQGGSSS